MPQQQENIETTPEIVLWIDFILTKLLPVFWKLPDLNKYLMRYLTHYSIFKLLRILMLGYLLAFDLLSGAEMMTSNETKDGFLLRNAVYGVGSRVNKSPKFYPYRLLADTKLNGCPDDAGGYLANIQNYTGPRSMDGGIEIFSLPPLVRYLYQFPKCISRDQLISIKQNLLGRPQKIFDHGTTNHALMYVTSWYLLAQMFPSEIWTDWDGRRYSSEEVLRITSEHILSRNQNFYKFGYAEMNSPTYALINYFPLLNLIDFSKDELIRRSAEKGAILGLSILRAHSFHGTIVAPLTRKNFDQINSSAQNGERLSVSQQLLWYYYDDPIGFDSYNFSSDGEPAYFVFLALTKWRPPPYVLDLPATKGDATTTIPFFGFWGNTTGIEVIGKYFFSDDYAVGVGNSFFYTDRYQDQRIQNFSLLIKSSKKFNQIECVHLGLEGWNSGVSSPFQHPYIYDRHNFGVVYKFDVAGISSKKMSDAAHLNKMACRVPLDFDELRIANNSIFFHESGVYGVLAPLKVEPNTRIGVQGDFNFKYLVQEGNFGGFIIKIFDGNGFSDRGKSESALVTPFGLKADDGSIFDVKTGVKIFDPVLEGAGVGVVFSKFENNETPKFPPDVVHSSRCLKLASGILEFLCNKSGVNVRVSAE